MLIFHCNCVEVNQLLIAFSNAFFITPDTHFSSSQCDSHHKQCLLVYSPKRNEKSNYIQIKNRSKVDRVT